MSENNPRGGYDDAANAANELSYENERLQSENAALRSMLERMAEKCELASKVSPGDDAIALVECVVEMKTINQEALAEYRAWKESQK